MVFTRFRENHVVERIFRGIRPAVVALIVSPLLGLGKSAGVNFKNIWIPLVVALSVWLLKISPPVYIILTAIILGIFHFIHVNR